MKFTRKAAVGDGIKGNYTSISVDTFALNQMLERKVYSVAEDLADSLTDIGGVFSEYYFDDFFERAIEEDSSSESLKNLLAVSSNQTAPEFFYEKPWDFTVFLWIAETLKPIEEKIDVSGAYDKLVDEIERQKLNGELEVDEQKAIEEMFKLLYVEFCARATSKFDWKAIETAAETAVSNHLENSYAQFTWVKDELAEEIAKTVWENNPELLGGEDKEPDYEEALTIFFEELDGGAFEGDGLYKYLYLEECEDAGGPLAKLLRESVGDFKKEFLEIAQIKLEETAENLKGGK